MTAGVKAVARPMDDGRRRQRTRGRVIGAVAALTVLVGACGSDDDDDGASASSAAPTSTAADAPTTTQSSVAPTTEAEETSTSQVDTGPKEPLKIGLVGWLSGQNPSTAISRQIVMAWKDAVNARGGINGHPIEVIEADDGGNDAQSIALVRDLVENKGVVALVAYQGVSVVGIGAYAQEKGVPIIGGQTVEAAWNENPMLFPTQPAVQGRTWGAARIAQEAGHTTVATLYCIEVPGCKEASDAFEAHAEELGVAVPYTAGVSLSAPDYTAQCVQMRDDEVTAVVASVNVPAALRFIQSCSRQQVEVASIFCCVSDALPKEAAFEGSIANLTSFPWFLREGSKGIEEYVATLEEHAPELLENGTDQQAGAWTAVKVFEHAAANVSDNPTSEEILEGLWSMKDETLDGLLVGGMALTYTRDQPTPEKYCINWAEIVEGKWTAPKGTEPLCRD